MFHLALNWLFSLEITFDWRPEYSFGLISPFRCRLLHPVMFDTGILQSMSRQKHPIKALARSLIWLLIIWLPSKWLWNKNKESLKSRDWGNAHPIFWIFYRPPGQIFTKNLYNPRIWNKRNMSATQYPSSTTTMPSMSCSFHEKNFTLFFSLK